MATGRWLGVVLLAGAASAQVPRTGEVEVYGIRRVSLAQVSSVVNVRPGDPLPRSKGDLEDRLERLSGVASARVEAVCCDGDRALLFVGIQEKDAPIFLVRPAPAGAAVLPGEEVERWRHFLEAVRAAARHGSAAEEYTRGYPLMADPQARRFQAGFVEYASHNAVLLRRVVLESANAEHRAIAANLAGYGRNKQEALDTLEEALRDPAEPVRAGAARALNAIYVLAVRRPDLGLRVRPDALAQMLNSIVLDDRVQAAAALVTLTDPPSATRPAALAAIRTRALASVTEMARWNALRYALPAYILVGRLAGLSEQAIQTTWTQGDRKRILARLSP